MSSNSVYIPGEVARISLTVTDSSGIAADPGALSLKIKPPSGILETYTYGSGVEIVRDSAGNFHADIQLSSAGRWAYRWELSTPNAGAAEGIIIVQKSSVI